MPFQLFVAIISPMCTACAVADCTTCSADGVCATCSDGNYPTSNGATCQGESVKCPRFKSFHVACMCDCIIFNISLCDHINFKTFHVVIWAIVLISNYACNWMCIDFQHMSTYVCRCMYVWLYWFSTYACCCICDCIDFQHKHAAIYLSVLIFNIYLLLYVCGRIDCIVLIFRASSCCYVHTHIFNLVNHPLPAVLSVILIDVLWHGFVGCSDFITECSTCTVTGQTATCTACSNNKYPDKSGANCVGKNGHVLTSMYNSRLFHCCF